MSQSKRNQTIRANRSWNILSQGYTRQIATLTMVGHRSTGDTVQWWVFFQCQGRGQQPKDTEGRQQMHGFFVQTMRNLSFIVSLTVTHAGAKWASGIYDVMRSVLTQGHWPLYWPRSAGGPWWDGWHRPKKQSWGGLKETKVVWISQSIPPNANLTEKKLQICIHDTHKKENHIWRETFKMCSKQKREKQKQKGRGIARKGSVS